MQTIGVVIIGRNEGERLRRCLVTVVERLHYVVYVDSGSTDGSVLLAREFGATVVALDMSLPFTASRGRNAGFACLMELVPDTKYVQFIDGDCELAEEWLEKAIEFLDSHKNHAVVCGHLRERYPDVSIYNRLCNIEWDGPVGDISTCGGIFMIRAKAFVSVGGMNSTISAGEEPEMCWRLQHKGWHIARIDVEMARHDAHMTSFGQWWKRALRSGCGAVDVYLRTKGDLFSVQVKRTWYWTIGWSFALLSVLGAKPIFEGTLHLLVVIAVVSLYPLQILRFASRMRRKGFSFNEALVCGGLMMVGKWAELIGQCSSYLSFTKVKDK